MADNTTLNSGSGGDTIASDDIGGVKHQRVKIEYGTDGAATDVSDTNPLPVDDAGGSLTVDNGGTFVTQVDGDALTALQLIDNIVVVDDAAFTLGSGSGVMVMGFAGTQSVNANDSAALACDTDGALHISDGGNTITVDGTVTANPASGTIDTVTTVTAVTDITNDVSIDDGGNVISVDISDTSFAVADGNALGEGVLVQGDDGTDRKNINVDATTGDVQVDVTNTVTVSGTVTSNLGATDNAVLDDIAAQVTTVADAVSTEMQVDVVAALPAGTNAIGKLAANSGVDIGDVDVTSLPASTNTLEVVGDVADDAAASGNPIAIGGFAKETDGTDPGSVSAENDRTELISDRNRRLLVNTAHPNLWSASENHTTAQTNNALQSAPGASLSLYITDLIISNGATAGNIKIVEDTAGTPVDIIEVMYFAANGGMCKKFATPIRVTANKDVGFTSVTCTTHSITLSGYIAP